jgi:glucokinase
MIFDYFGKHFDNALLTIIYAYDTEVIVIGGSVAKAKDYYAAKAIEIVNNRAYSKSKVRILFSELNNAALLGAASLI